MQNRKPKQTLPKPDAMHHIVEDFLTAWDGPTSHILPLRRFLESVFQQDLRFFTVEDCFQMSLLYQNPAYMCEEHFLSGQGFDITPDLFLPSAGDESMMLNSKRRNTLHAK